jgi:5-methylcytosine-specific restriction endonuclease McrA
MAEHQLSRRTCGLQFQYHRRKAYCAPGRRLSAIAKQFDPKASLEGLAPPKPVPACQQDHQCLNCDMTFKPKRAGRIKFCGRACSYEFMARKAALLKETNITVRKVMRKRRAKPRTVYSILPQALACKNCGIKYKPTSSGGRPSEYCSSDCKAIGQRVQAKVSKSARRARICGASAVDRIDPIKVFERDGWRCGVCGCKTHRQRRGTYHPKAPELDHVVALANGGSHTWGNVQCACRECNGRKGASNFGQLLLFPAA